MENKKLDYIIDKLLIIKPIIFKNLIKPQWITPQITMGTHYVIIILYKYGSLTMSEISNLLAMPKPNVTAVVDKLIRQGYVKRIYDEEDRRKIKASLTDKGVKLKEEIDVSIRTNLRNKLDVLTTEELDKLSDSLNTVVEILSKIPSE